MLGLGVADWERQALPQDLRSMIELREQARLRNDYATADKLREQLLEAGEVVKDTPAGTQWYFVRRGEIK